MMRQTLLFATGCLLLLPSLFKAHAQEKEEQRRAVEEITKLAPEWVKRAGGQGLLEISDGGVVLGVTLNGSKSMSDEGLVLLQPFSKLRKLELASTNITDKG